MQPNKLCHIEVTERLVLCFSIAKCCTFHPNRRSADYRASMARGTVSSGFTLYQACMTFASSSIRKEDRIIPSYFLPYIDFSPQAPYAFATLWSGSERSGKPSLYLMSNFICLSGGSGLIPTASMRCFCRSFKDVLTLQACFVQPGVSAFLAVTHGA